MKQSQFSLGMSAPLLRNVAVVLSVLLVLQASAPAFASTALEDTPTDYWVTYEKQENPGPYPAKATVAQPVKQPGYDEISRGGIWSFQTLSDWQAKRSGDKEGGYSLLACIDASLYESLAPPPSSAGSYPWEGTFGGVNTATGNLTRVVPIVSWSSVGQSDVNLSLVYNSLAAFGSGSSPVNECFIGAGWRMSYDWRLIEVSNSGSYLDAAVTTGDGTTITFTNTGTSYTRPVGYFDSLVANSGGGWTLTRTDQSKYTFDASGWLTKVEDRFGNAVNITRDATNHWITKISDPGSGGTAREINLAWASAGGGSWTVTITDPAGRSWVLNLTGDPTYSTTLLDRVDYPTINFTSYNRDFGYDGSSQLTSDADRRSKTTSFTYISGVVGKISTTQTPESRVTEYRYNTNRWNISATGTTSIVEKGTSGSSVDWAIWEHKYNTNALEYQVDPVAGPSLDYYNEHINTRNSDQQPTQVTDRNGKVWNFTYTSGGDLDTVTDPLSHTKKYWYNSTHDPIKFENGLGKQWEYEYYDGIITGGPAGALRRIKDPLYSVSTSARYQKYAQTLTYDSYGNLATVVVPGPSTTTYTTTLAPNTHGDVTSVTKADGTYSSWNYGSGSAYDASLGDPVSSTSAAGVVTSYAYDAWLRLSSQYRGSDPSRYWFYDEEDNVTEYRNALDTNTDQRRQYWTYDGEGEVATYINALGDQETYGYDNLGYLKDVTNGRGFMRTYTTSKRGDVTQLTMPESNTGGTVTSWSNQYWSYDGNGNVSYYTNGIPQTINYGYDSDGRMTGVDYTTGTDTAFTYDSADQRTGMTDSSGSSSWGYDEAGQQTSFSDGNGSFSWVYRADGQTDTMSETGVGTTTYGYDSYGRPETLQNPASETTQWTYDTYGRVWKQQFSAGHREEYGFDSSGRLNETTVKTSGGSSLDYQKLSYDSEDRMSYRRRGTSSSSYVQTDYGYDKADQLLQEENNASGASYFKGVYVYDQNGNRTSKALTGGTGSAVTTSFSYDAGDKLITYGSYTIPYDAAGRPTQWPVNRPSSGYGLAYMNWDYEGRLTQIKASSGGTSVPFFTSTYNGLNTRVAANAAPAGTLGYRRFSRSGANVTAPVRSMRWGNLLSPSYTRSTPGVSKRTGSTTTYAHNGIKNEDAQSQSSTAISATKDYDAWGNVIGSTGTWQGISGYGGPYGYQEDETGIKLLGNRFYDSGAGRFLSRDPIESGRNWYSYCDNDPIGGADPTGTLRTDIARGAALLADTDAAGALAMKPIPPLITIPGWVKSLLTLFGLAAPEQTGEGKTSTRRFRPLYRAVEPGEAKAIHKNGGLPVPSPTYETEKPFWTTPQDAARFGAQMFKRTQVSFEIWCWPNPFGIGYPGVPMDGMPTWMVPYPALPLVGPGFPIKWR